MIRRFLLFSLFFVLTILIYRNGLHIPYYADDFQRLFTNPTEAAAQAFTHANFSDGSYRPLETLALGVIQIRWGWDTFPIRLLSLLFHAAGALLVFQALRFWNVNKWCAMYGAIFVVVSQLSAAAVLGNDTQSQVTGSFFSALSLWMLYRYNLNRNQWRRYFLSMLFFFLALISKETSAGLCISVAFLIYTMEQRRNPDRFKQIVLNLLPFVFIFGLYWLLRIHAGGVSPQFGDENLSLDFGINIPVNIGLFTVQSLLPISSMAVMKAMHYKDHLQLALMLGFALLYCMVIGFGMLRSRHKPIVKALAVFIFCSWFPPIILNHISELYDYNAIFFLGALVGIAMEYYWNALRNSSQAAFAMVVTIMLFVIITNAIGVDEKASSMKIQGDRAAVFLPQIVSIAKALPPHKWMYLVGQNDSSFEYSMFAIHGFRAVATSDSVVRFLSHRPDMGIFLSDSAGCAKRSKNNPGIAFTYDPRTFRIYPYEPDFTAQPMN